MLQNQCFQVEVLMWDLQMAMFKAMYVMSYLTVVIIFHVADLFFQCGFAMEIHRICAKHCFFGFNIKRNQITFNDN